MNAILTKSGRDKKTKKTYVVATTASGKSKRFYTQEPSQYFVACNVAKNLSVRMGWGSNLVGGETKDGFAFIPIQEPKKQETTQDQAASLIERVASRLAPGCQDPIRIAAGINDLKNK